MSTAAPLNLNQGRPNDLARVLTARFLQYPNRPDRRTEILEEIANFFVPNPGLQKVPPVAGIAVDKDANVVVFLSEPNVHINGAVAGAFAHPFGVSIAERYTGPFRLCAAAGASLGYGNVKGPTGTLGCIVQDTAKDEFVLSCNHVIADSNSGTIKKDEMWSPGHFDHGTKLHRIGLLWDFEQVRIGGVITNTMDAAIGKLDTNSGPPYTILYIGSVSGVDGTPGHNTRVQKYGKTTYLTKGDLTFQNVSFKAPFGAGQALFVDQYLILGDGGLPFANDGDSGSLVLNLKNEAVGLVIAVAGTGETAVVSPIDPILKRFGVSF